MIWIQATRKVDPTKTAGTNEDEHQSNAISRLFRISIAAAFIGGAGTFAGSQTT
ncbi:hypothetical protein [Mesorhizobium escarrei]|uniref:Uncharacterized protein n=1 Tax=Mesorhizobium escarrei TaxID=666018 RepID=A0ABM9DVN9_9HYPH|nr:hypothetical protein [Mesorhizobium escarrei]CAH2400251.1 hypothetical protein MES5069_250048 [Mesorhizobium escarrei]